MDTFTHYVVAGLLLTFMQPQADPKCPDVVIPLPLSLWNDVDDTFEHAKQPILNELANWAGISPAEFAVAFQQRIDCLEKLSQGQGADVREMYNAIDKLRKRAKKSSP